MSSTLLWYLYQAKISIKLDTILMWHYFKLKCLYFLYQIESIFKELSVFNFNRIVAKRYVKNFFSISLNSKLKYTSLTIIQK